MSGPAASQTSKLGAVYSAIPEEDQVSANQERPAKTAFDAGEFLLARPGLAVGKVLGYLFVALFLICEASARSAATGAQVDAGSASRLSGQNESQTCEGPPSIDLAATKESVQRFRRAHDLVNEADAVNSLGIHYADSGETKSSIPYLKQGSELYQQLGKPGPEAHLLTLLADAYIATGDSPAAIIAVKRAIAISQTIQDPAAEAAATTILGDAYASTDLDKAKTWYARALELSVAAGDTRTHATVLNDQGTIVQNDDPQLAVRLFTQALALANTARDCSIKAAILSNLASVYEQQGKPHDALDSYSEAVTLERLIRNRSDEARILHAQAKAYEDLGDLPNALSLFRQALALERANADLAFEGPTLSAIAGVSNELGKPREALSQYSAAMVVLKKTGDLDWQMITLNNLGSTYRDLGLPGQSRHYYHQAMMLVASSGNRIILAYSLWGLGRLEESDALPDYFRALHLAEELEQPELEGLIDVSLMNHYRRQRKYDLAIFFGKQAVEHFQSIRHSMDGLGSDLIASFLQTKAQSYRDLAEILILRGRLPEASQVLDLLKLQEYSDYVRGFKLEATANPTKTATEDQFEQRYQELTRNIVELDKHLHDLSLDQHRTTDKQAEYDQLREQVRTADNEFDQYLHHLYLAFKDQDDANDKIQTLKRASSSLQDAIARAPGTVGVYVLSGETRLRLIVMTGSDMVWRSYPISKGALAGKCYDYLNKLSHPGSDPKQLAEDLFNIVFAPIQRDVVASEAKTIVWHLDGPLRYIPMGALVDPKDGKFLIVHYNMVNYAAFNFYLADKPNLDSVSAIAMGISHPYGQFHALPNVEDELGGIVTDPTVNGSHGQFSGTILLNDRFTWKAMDEQVGSQSIVHIASHFVLSPGSADQSYLLLAGKDQASSGYHLSVADLKNDRDLNLAGKELVTLSACQTGSGTAEDAFHQSSLPAGDGFEVEGVSDAILEKRAKSVISSLWSVSDQSTSILMVDFYRQWIGAKGTMTKIEALRNAQLDLLQGRATPGLSDAPSSAGFSHPYYWAPFVLMGNWK